MSIFSQSYERMYQYAEGSIFDISVNSTCRLPHCLKEFQQQQGGRRHEETKQKKDHHLIRKTPMEENKIQEKV